MVQTVAKRPPETYPCRGLSIIDMNFATGKTRDPASTVARSVMVGQAYNRMRQSYRLRLDLNDCFPFKQMSLF